ncbi:MAG TPA: tetratricopeptide repeat protein [Polyangia bacterium]
MKRRLRSVLLALGISAGFGAVAANAHADECPESVPSSSSTRRGLAKDWFSRAEAADAAGDPIGAVRAYQCSLKMVPHAFTAFNLGRLAERTGDLELAVEAFNTYIKLAPEAPDRNEIQAKISALGTRIETMRAQNVPGEADPQPTPEVTPPVPSPTTQPLDVSAPADAPVASDDEPFISKRKPAAKSTVTPWIVGGVGVASLATGVALNLSARSKMNDCRALAAAGRTTEANTACDAAAPRAYASYALFGVAAAAAITDAVLLFVLKEPSQERTIAASPLPGGAAVSGRWRF